MKIFLGIMVAIFILSINGCLSKKSEIISEQLLENSKSKQKLMKSDCQARYGNYPRTYHSYNEFNRCEFKGEYYGN